MKNATTRGQLNIVLLCFIFHHLCYEIRQYQTAVFLLWQGQIQYPNMCPSCRPKQEGRRGAGSINAPSDCAQRNARAACPGPCSAGPFVAKIWDNHRVTQLSSMNKIEGMILISCPLVLGEGISGILSTLNVNKTKSSTLWNGILPMYSISLHDNSYCIKGKILLQCICSMTPTMSHKSATCNSCENCGITTFLWPWLEHTILHVKNNTPLLLQWF